MGYIWRRRLETVHVLLSDPAEARSLAELALAFGFSSHAHFSTAFRRRFGYAPRDARLGAAANAPGVAAQLFERWMLILAGPPEQSDGRVPAR
jgi:AraC-like DNA-binding protein